MLGLGKGCLVGHLLRFLELARVPDRSKIVKCKLTRPEPDFLYLPYTPEAKFLHLYHPRARFPAT